MRAAAFQFDVRRGEVDANLRTVEAALRRAAEQGIELVVLPEMWPTSFPPPGGAREDLLRRSDEALERLAELAGELELIVCGSAFAAPEPWLDDAPSPRPANRLQILDGTGAPGPARTLLAYDKVHLFTPTAEDEIFSAGHRPPPAADTRAGRLSGIVCYDLRFPELTRVPFHEGAQILCVPAQWPTVRAAHFRALAAGVAVANQCFVVLANRTGSERAGRRQLELSFPGQSLIVDPNGSVLAEGGSEEALVPAEIDLTLVRELRARVPVSRDQRPLLYAAWSTEEGRALANGDLSGGF
jgi:omega-amidase